MEHGQDGIEVPANFIDDEVFEDGQNMEDKTTKRKAEDQPGPSRKKPVISVSKNILVKKKMFMY